jgi:hypothetical protein
MGGYAYAADNPATHSDPTGLNPRCLPGDSGCATQTKLATGNGFYAPPTIYPGGTAVDLVAAVVHTAARVASVGPFGQYALRADNWLNHALGVQSNSDMYALGNDGSFLASLFVGGGEGDAAEGLGVLADGTAASSGRATFITDSSGVTVETGTRLPPVSALASHQIINGSLRQGVLSTGSMTFRAGTEVANMTDPTQLAEELAGESSYNTLSKVWMHDGENVGDAGTQMVVPWQPASAHAGDAVTSVGLMVAAILEVAGRW